VLNQDQQERDDKLILFRTLWATDFHAVLYVVYTESDAYPVLQNAIERSDAELTDFAELLILN